LLDGSDPLAISRLALLEVSSAIVRRGRAAGISEQDLNTVLAELDREVSQSFDLVELTISIMARALELTRQHALRRADAIQLASAISASEANPLQELNFVRNDQELNAAAMAEGFSIIDPTQN
jgi:predicted nucleic acid-binding protein